MSEFSLELLAKKLSELNESQESVETLALWIIHHRRHAEVIVKYWSERFIISSDKRKLAMLFVVNDIFRSNKFKSRVYKREFAQILPDALCHIAETYKLERLVKQAQRMVKIWQRRRYFKPDVMEKFWTALGTVCSKETVKNDETKTAMKEIGNESTPNESDNDADNEDFQKMFLAFEAPEADELIAALKAIEANDLPSYDNAMRTKISYLPVKDVKSLPDREKAAQYFKELESGLKLIDIYNEQLDDELMQREKLDKMLNAYKEAELEKVADIEEKMQQLVDEIDRVKLLRKEIQCHRASFPDFEKLNSCNELPPLPNVEDLFKKQLK